MPSYLVTGAGRGLGLGFVAELLKSPDNTVIATARNTAAATGLQELKASHEQRLHLVTLDVESAASIEAAAEQTAILLPDGLDHLVHSAGVAYNSMRSFEDSDVELFKREMDFNVVGTTLLYRNFLPLLRRGQAKKILVVTSSLGSVTLGNAFPNLANTYSVGKAALNMLVRKWGASLVNDDIIAGLVHPGYVGSTGLGQGIADWVATHAPGLPDIPVNVSVAGCLKVLHDLTKEQNGSFHSYDGTAIPF